MASVTAKIQVESVLDDLAALGWRVTVLWGDKVQVLCAKDSRLLRGQGDTLVQAFMDVSHYVTASPFTGISTEGASWAMEAQS